MEAWFLGHQGGKKGDVIFQSSIFRGKQLVSGKVPSQSSTSPLKNDGWKTTLLFGWYIFRGELLNFQGVVSIKSLKDIIVFIANHHSIPISRINPSCLGTMVGKTHQKDHLAAWKNGSSIKYTLDETLRYILKNSHGVPTMEIWKMNILFNWGDF